MPEALERVDLGECRGYVGDVTKNDPHSSCTTLIRAVSLRPQGYSNCFGPCITIPIPTPI